MLNMKDLYAFEIEREKLKQKTYDKILKKCHNKIKINAANGIKFCWFEVPEVTLGLPDYNVMDVSIYMKNKLLKNGLLVNYYEPNILYISWNK